MLNLDRMMNEQNNVEQSQLILDQILEETKASGVYLVDRDGFLVAESGEIDLDRVALSALSAASFGATAEIARILGEHDFSRVTHLGQRQHLFMGKAGLRHILIVVFGSETNLGLVKLYVEQTVEALADLLDSGNGVTPYPTGTDDEKPLTL